MSIKANQKKRRRGLTMIEIVVAMVIIVVAVTGAMGYRYYSILDARKARVKITAARVGSMFLESWKGTGGRSVPEDAFDPKNFDFGSKLIVSGSGGTAVGIPGGFIPFGAYAVSTDGSNYYAALSYSDDAGTNLRTLNIAVAWPQKYPSGAFTSEDLWTYTQSVRFTSKVLTPDGG